MALLVPVMSHDHKGYFTAHVNCLNLRNAVMPLVMLLAGCDTDVSASGIK